MSKRFGIILGNTKIERERKRVGDLVRGSKKNQDRSKEDLREDWSKN